VNRNQFFAGAAALIAGSILLLLGESNTRVLAYLLMIAGTVLAARSCRGRPLWPYFVLIFLLSMTIRIHRLNQLDPMWLVPNDDRELGAIAFSLVETGEFADPYLIHTGPTAHLPPIPPLILSVIIKTVGLNAQAGYVTAMSFFVTASILYGLLPWLAQSFGLGAPAGIMAGLFGALVGLTGSIWAQLPGHGEFLAGLFMALLLAAFLHRWRSSSASWLGSILLGAAAGAAFHVQPALLMVILGCMLFELWWMKGRNQRLMVGAIALGIVLACLPWGWRNYTTFDAVFFIRSNFGLELRMGNNPTAQATFEEMDASGIHQRHPRIDTREARLVLELGEAEYMQQVLQEALAWIRKNPGRFASLTIHRFANVWIGPIYGPLEDVVGVLALTCLAIAGLWRSWPGMLIPQRAVVLIPLVTFPMVYYVVAYSPRYRMPLDWVLYVLAGAALWLGIRGTLKRVGRE
jgi:hypothetical protein